jgi:hypothetical protein
MFKVFLGVCYEKRFDKFRLLEELHRSCAVALVHWLIFQSSQITTSCETGPKRIESRFDPVLLDGFTLI